MGFGAIRSNNYFYGMAISAISAARVLYEKADPEGHGKKTSKFGHKEQVAPIIVMHFLYTFPMSYKLLVAWYIGIIPAYSWHQHNKLSYL